MFIYPLYPLKKILWPEKGLESVRCLLSQRFVLGLDHAFSPFCHGPLLSLGFLVLTYLSLRVVCFPQIQTRVPEFQPQTLMDFGSGTGSVAW